MTFVLDFASTSTKDRYGPEGPGSRTGGSNVTERIVWTIFRSHCSVWFIPGLDRSDPDLTQFLVCSLWLIPQLSLFDLSHTRRLFVRFRPKSSFLSDRSSKVSYWARNGGGGGAFGCYCVRNGWGGDTKIFSNFL